jgi:hypothetical protein
MSTANRWKYMVVTVKGVVWTGIVSDERLQAELNQHGNVGWELVNAVAMAIGIKLVFKRPM